jgi:hypothetical protein
MPRLRVPRATAIVAALFWTAACAEPPTRELNQAQGAIDAARAAGAAEFAATELTAAEDSLKRAHDAVGQRDYRQALSLAIDSKERARDAARQSAARMAQLKSDADLIVQTASVAIAQARARLAGPDFSRLPAGRLARLKSELNLAEKTVQEARTAADRREYAKARAGAESALVRVRQALAPATESDEKGRPRTARPSTEP